MLGTETDNNCRGMPSELQRMSLEPAFTMKKTYGVQTHPRSGYRATRGRQRASSPKRAMSATVN